MEQQSEEKFFDNSPDSETPIPPIEPSSNMEVHHHAHHDHGNLPLFDPHTATMTQLIHFLKEEYNLTN